MRKTGILIFIIACVVTTRAQQVWTLEKCVEHALSNNIQLKQQQLQVKNQQAMLLQDKLGMLPSLNAGASHAYNYGKTIDRYTNAFATERVQSDNFYLGSSVSLFNGFQKINQIAQRKMDLEAANYDTDKFMDDLSLDIATGYLQILYYNEVVKTAENQLNATQLQADRLKKLVDAGALAKGEFYAIDAQRAADHSQLVNARNNLDLAYLTLSQMLDLPSAEGFTIEFPDLELGLLTSMNQSPEQIYGAALETQPQIKAAEARLRSSDMGLKMARNSQYPSLELQGSLGTGFSGANKILDSTTFDIKTKPFADQVNDNFNRSIALNLSVPIFNGWSTRTSISRAKLNSENQKYNLELSKLQLRKTIQQAYADAKAALNNYEASITGVNAARESFRYAEQKFTVGSLNSVDYNNAKKDLEKAESDQLRSKYEYIFKSSVLDFYMGKPITLKRK
jgi:outer membrane protein